MFARSLGVTGYRLKMLITAFFLLLAAPCMAAEQLLNSKQVDALRPLLCDACVPKSKLILYRGGLENIHRGEGFPWIKTSKIPASSISEPTEAEVSNPSDLNALVAPDDVRPLGNTVCLGKQIPKVLIEALRPRNGEITELVPIPEIEAVCIGELQDLELFLQGVVDAMFMSRLQKYEDALNKEAIDAAIKASLRDVVFQYQTQWAAKVKEDVLKELDRPTAPNQPPPVTDDPKQCKSGNLASCPGKSTTECCICLEADGAQKAGTCLSTLDRSSWKPKVIPEKQLSQMFEPLLNMLGFSPQTSNQAQSEELQETYRGPCSGSINDSSGETISCSGERPVCYSDGTCTCEADSVCD